MHLRCGIPAIADLKSLQQQELYRRHVDFNRQFLQVHAQVLNFYGKRWGFDPYRMWSRRWEYPFVAQRLLEFLQKSPGGPLHLLDAGSGVTYLPYLLLEQLPALRVTCVDSNAGYAPLFEAIGSDRRTDAVRFVEGFLQKLAMPDASVDAICCISVLEHTDDYGSILAEFRRVLKPGGLLVLTFDLSLDGRFRLSAADAAALLKRLAEMFEPEGQVDHQRELERMSSPEILTTEYVLRNEPEMLPWRHPWLLALRDLFTGKGWTGGFRSKSVYCLSATAR
jgi:ubiquinone/menaquinone biosynthesis C-methylase UbiE